MQLQARITELNKTVKSQKSEISTLDEKSKNLQPLAEMAIVLQNQVHFVEMK